MTVNLATGAASGGFAAGDSFVGVERAFGSQHADQLTGDAGANLLYGFDGDDVLSGGAGNDTLRGDGGADTFIFAEGGGNDRVIDFTSGEDSISVSGIESFADLQALITQNGNDVRIQLSSTDSITLVGTQVADLSESDFDLPDEVIPLTFITGTSGDDVLIGGDGPQRISGLAGRDFLSGEAGDDILVGGGGNDRFDGGTGNDMIFSSGLGFDTFIFNEGDGHDIIYGFDPIRDMIDLSSSFGDGDLNNAMQVGDDVVFDYGGGDSITLANLDIGDIINLEDFEVFV